MLKSSVSYMFQLIHTVDGSRSAAVTATPEKFIDFLQSDLCPSPVSEFMVIVLCELESDDPNEFVLRVPLMYVSTFIDWVNQLEVSHA